MVFINHFRAEPGQNVARKGDSSMTPAEFHNYLEPISISKILHVLNHFVMPG
ncbi:MAG: hypothetical protein HW386_1201 [Gammaproteobacteria bacterium]|nr:hypothetical protein [Gammaproteobacteria bacterium]